MAQDVKKTMHIVSKVESGNRIITYKTTGNKDAHGLSGNCTQV